MAQSGFTPLQLYYSSTTTNVPTSGNLLAGELAINTADGKLFYKDSSGVVQTIATKASAANSFSAGTTGFTPNTATTGAVTLAGTLVVSNGGTGLTTLTAGYIPYGAGTSAFGSVSTFKYDTTNNTLSAPTMATTSVTSVTPALSFNASNSPHASGASVSGTYLQFVLQNKSGTAGASTNYVLSNDLGTDSTYYGEFGMNSSTYTASGTFADFYSINNGIYYSGHDGDVSLGSGNGFKTYLTWGTTGQSAHVINASGAIGLSTNLGTSAATTGTTGFGTSGQVLTSAGSAAPAAWSSVSSLAVTTFSAGTTGFTPSSATSGAITLAGTLITTNGGTGLSSYTAGDLLYYATGSVLSKLGIGTSNYVLTSSGTAPQYVAQSTLSVGTATNVAGGTAGAVHYQSGAGATTFLALGTTNYVLTAGASAPQYVAQSTLAVGTATNLAGGAAGSLPYNTASATTTYLGIGSSGTVLTSSGTAPQWSASLNTSQGGTGLTSFTAGDLIYYTSGTTFTKLGIGTAGQVLTVNVGATAPQWSTTSASGVTSISFGSTGLTPSTASTGAVTVAGTLALASGGTGATTVAAAQTNLQVDPSGTATAMAIALG